MNIRFLYFEGCPNVSLALEKLQRILQEEHISEPIEKTEVANLETAQRLKFLGSPTIQINGLDIEEKRHLDTPCVGCRIYSSADGPKGVPQDHMIRDAVRRAKGSKQKILFLCTGNSCRSQMAEGWARHLKGDMIESYSAGIEPRSLNPRAVKVMAEAGVDISRYRSKNVDELKETTFDYVVTVCDHANEVCPIFAGNTKMVHVGFDDPPNLSVGVKSEEEILSHYRRVRDEIKLFVEKLPQVLTVQMKNCSDKSY